MSAIARANAAYVLAAAGVFALALLAAAFSRLYAYGVDGPVSNPTDFRAFYCAGSALAEGRNPYRVEPLRTCERSVVAANGLQTDERHTLPAPFPPYALLPFAALSTLPFRRATELWLATNVTCLALTVLAVSRLSGFRPGVVALVLIGSAGYASLITAQMMPVVLAGIVYAAYAARRGDGVGAAAGATVAALEPHLALPVWCALALFVPGSRLPLAAVASFYALTFALWPGLSFEYFVTVLPQHARSELYDFPAQYGLSSALATAGLPPAAALRLGTLSYACMLALGLLIARRLSRRFADESYAVLAPVAAVLLGGPFVHAHQMAAALPFALVLLSDCPARTRAFAWTAAAVFVLAVPWETLAEMPLVADRLPHRPAVGVRAPLPEPAPNAPVERMYTAFVDAFAQAADSRTIAEQLATKLPTWGALVVLLAVGTRLAWRGLSRGRARPR